MKPQIFKTQEGWHSSSGRSIVEILIVFVIAAILAAIAVPQAISARRAVRSSALANEIASQIRFARQQAMSQRQAFTFQYDDSTKQITIIDHNATGATVLSTTGYPNTAGSTTALTVTAGGGGGLPTSEISFGLPNGVSVTALPDTTTPTALASNKLTITFQPDGTVIDANNTYTNRSLFLYNNVIPNQAAFAISVLGSAGRVKIWRRTTGNTYVE